MTDQPREIEIGVTSSLQISSERELQSDIMRLREMQQDSRQAIEINEQQMAKQQAEKEVFERLAADPTSNNDGVTYNPTACQAAADRCDKHIGMFKALNKKERAKIHDLDYMIGEIEERISKWRAIQQSTIEPMPAA